LRQIDAEVKLDVCPSVGPLEERNVCVLEEEEARGGRGLDTQRGGDLLEKGRLLLLGVAAGGRDQQVMVAAREPEPADA